MTDIYLKYKIELDAVDKYINNKYIYDMFYNYGFNLDNKFIELDSNINIYEACFIARLINIYINTYKIIPDEPLRVVEVGLAYGTSALIIINEIIKYKYKTRYIVIDPIQSDRWKNIGMLNIKQFLKHMNKKLKVKLIEKYSTVAMPRLNKKYDISFIDGSHDELIVSEDIKNSDRILVKNGLIIIDDVLHRGVKDAILKFFVKNKNYTRISILENSDKFIRENTLYSHNLIKQSFDNPRTMYCFQKII
jgi:predicted O-methyltransferase YrrM